MEERESKNKDLVMNLIGERVKRGGSSEDKILSGREEESDPMTPQSGGQRSRRRCRIRQHQRSQERREYQGGVVNPFSTAEVQGSEV